MMKKLVFGILVLATVLLFSQTFRLEKILGFSEVSAMTFENGYLVLGTGNGEIVVYRDGSYYRAFKVHENRVNSVVYSDGFVVSASDDKNSRHHEH